MDIVVARHLAILAIAVTSAVGLVGCGGGSPPAADQDVVARASAAADAPDAVADADADADAGAPRGAAGGDDAGLVVDVAGEVRTPGVYRMPLGSRVHDAIQAAGGLRRTAEVGGLNRAAVLVDGQQVLVAAAGAAPPPGGAAGDVGVAGAAGTHVNINTASPTELEDLPGIGAVTAERIVASRTESGPFASIDDLDRVDGIGPATIEALRSAATT